jgi:hypothetical protein
MNGYQNALGIRSGVDSKPSMDAIGRTALCFREGARVASAINEEVRRGRN